MSKLKPKNNTMNGHTVFKHKKKGTPNGTGRKKTSKPLSLLLHCRLATFASRLFKRALKN